MVMYLTYFKLVIYFTNFKLVMHLTKAAPLSLFPCTKVIVKLTETNCHLPFYTVYDDYAIHKCASKPNLIVYTLCHYVRKRSRPMTCARFIAKQKKILHGYLNPLGGYMFTNTIS